MFLAIFQQPIEGRGNSVSSLFVRRSVFRAFFPKIGHGIQESGTYNPNDHPSSTQATDVDFDMSQSTNEEEPSLINGNSSELDTNMD
jgi:hypothetical protein